MKRYKNVNLSYFFQHYVNSYQLYILFFLYYRGKKVCPLYTSHVISKKGYSSKYSFDKEVYVSYSHKNKANYSFEWICHDHKLVIISKDMDASKTLNYDIQRPHRKDIPPRLRHRSRSEHANDDIHERQSYSSMTLS